VPPLRISTQARLPPRPNQLLDHERISHEVFYHPQPARRRRASPHPRCRRVCGDHHGSVRFHLWGLPWDTPIQTLQNDLTGPVATGISVIAFLAAGAALVFGEELGGIAKKALYVVLGVAMIVMGNKFLSDLGLSGAVI
jgi:Type IV secretory pathway, VirB2 components (pilins)